MLDDLRQQADQPVSEELDFEEDLDIQQDEKVNRKPFLGLSPQQRFILSILLLVGVILMSGLCLLVTGKIALPFL